MATFLTSTEFAVGYIGLMIAIFFICWVRVLLPYFSSKKAEFMIKSKLDELSNITDLNAKFHSFNDWMKNQDNKYIKGYLLSAWDNFYGKYESYQQKGILYTPDVYDFFFEEPLVHNFGRRKFAEVIGGIFLSMGIVGTFIGIAFGVSQVHVGGDSGVMQDGISTLLTGMKVKFFSSIAGVILSLIWQLIDKRSFYPMLTNSFSSIRQQLDEAFPTLDQSVLLLSIDQRQKEQMQDFQSFLSDVLIPNMVNGVADSIQKSLAPQMERTEKMMTDLMQTTTVNQSEGMQQMVNQFVTQLNELTGDHMKNLGEALNNTVEWQKKVHEEMGALVQSMQDSAAGQSAMVDKTTVLTEQIHNYTERITDYQTVLERTVSELNETTEKNSELQKVTADLLDRMTEERNTFNGYFESHMNTLKENVESIVTQTGLQVTFQQRLEENLQRISSITQSQQSLAVTLSQQAELSQRSNQELELIFDKFTNNNTEFVHIQEDMQSLMREIQHEREAVGNISTRVQDQLSEQLESMDKRVEHLQQVWTSASESMSKTNKHLEVSMNQFTDDMHRGLQNTFTQFDQELTKSVQHLASGVDAIQEGLIDLPDAMQTLKQTVLEINRQSKRIMNPVTSE